MVNAWTGPFFVTSQYDVNMRLRADCVARGANRVHLTNSCFRIPGRSRSSRTGVEATSRTISTS